MKSVFQHAFSFWLIIGLCGYAYGQAGQIQIARVEQMPNEPSPYIMRNWKNVATAYDSMVYDIAKTGQHLPLVFIRPQGTNYPGQPSFGLDTYIGTFSNNNGEAINVLPSLVGASLVGIDKTQQFGRNWILMSQDYFNRANGEFLYLNNIGGHSGHDWWYDMMPNIYFYQLYDLYGKIGDAENQFHRVADRMAEAVRAMGGSATPWTRAFMGYRAWDFLNMQPNPNGVHEPEAAGAFAWLMYHAYRETGNPSYLQAAEWSMEYLINLNSNPSYELQLPYGAYIAARMNAEIGTEYNIEKLLFWIFNRGPLRGWGTIVGQWNGFDVSGLVGEANDGGNDYAFQLNGVQQAGALVPLVRYDKRFARTIGKWMLNVANATRLMFPGSLPGHLQDASTWSNTYDPEGVIGYEALREQWTGLSPFATGDALRSGWAATNLSLYSTSSIGYMGALIEKTNEPKILKLDLRRTDFFHAEAYPSYLLYNPLPASKIIMINVGPNPTDIYDAISESFLSLGVTGETSIEIPADQVVSIVLAPAGGMISYENNKMMIDGVVVDFRQSALLYNYPPRIQAFATELYTVEKNTTITLYAKGLDQETKDLVYTFYMPEDTLSGLGKTATWTAPDQTGFFDFKLIIADEDQLTDTATFTLEVVDEINIAPEIISLKASKRYAEPGGIIHLTSVVIDANGDSLTYIWTASQGDIIGSDDVADWLAPPDEGIFIITLRVSDGQGGTAMANIRLLVLDPEKHKDGNLVAWYPFEGDAQDISGNRLNGQVFGAKLTTDSLGSASAAYFFDGINDHIRVTNEPILNFKDGITVSFFAQPQTIGDKERFFISHGSWQNRWKISITPDRKVRWTLKNTSGQVKDLDSESMLEEGRFYHIAATYDGRFMILYINGQPESFTEFTGDINPSSLDLEIGQILPDDPMYNFRGVLDEIKIYDFALQPDSVAVLSGHVVTGLFDPSGYPQTQLRLYPNPSKGFVMAGITHMEDKYKNEKIRISIRDITGRVVRHEEKGSAEVHRMDVSGLNPGLYFITLEIAGHHWTQKCIIEK